MSRREAGSGPNVGICLVAGVTRRCPALQLAGCRPRRVAGDVAQHLVGVLPGRGAFAAGPSPRRRSATAPRSTAGRPGRRPVRDPEPAGDEVFVVEEVAGSLTTTTGQPPACASRIAVRRCRGGGPPRDGAFTALDRPRPSRPRPSAGTRARVRSSPRTATIRGRCGRPDPAGGDETAVGSLEAAAGREPLWRRRRSPAASRSRSRRTTAGSNGAGRGCRSASRTSPRRRAGRAPVSALEQRRRGWPAAVRTALHLDDVAGQFPTGSCRGSPSCSSAHPWRRRTISVIS